MNKKISTPASNVELWPPRTGQFNHTLAAHDLMDDSIAKSGVLPRLVARIHPTKRGMYQVPFGALLLERIKKRFGPDYEVSLELGDFDNDDMIRMFNLENNEAWHNLPISYIEVVHAVRTAHRNGEIKIGKKSESLSAPDIAEYLGGDWMNRSGRAKERVFWCMNALTLMESGDVKTSDLVGLSVNQVNQLIEELIRRKKQRERDAEFAEKQAKQAKHDAEKAPDEPTRDAFKRRANFHEQKAAEHRTRAKAETKQLVNEVGTQLREHKLASNDIRRKSEEVVPSYTPPKKAPPWLFQAAKKMATQVGHILAPDDKRAREIREIVKVRDQLDSFSHQLLVEALTDLAERVNQLARALGQPPSRPAADANPKKLSL